ncbi:LVIVD repeat protein [bacterium BMS3Bbin04]|nr:LVIVD repeat protein [bacterium BMS3Bbin04]
MKHYFVALMLLFVLVSAAGAQDSLNVSTVGLLEHEWDSAKVVRVIDSNYAYLATGATGLRIVDVSDPAAPVEIGSISYDDPHEVYDVAISGDYAYLAVGNHGLRAIDVSDPADPIEVGSYPTPSAALGVCVQGDFVYVAVRWDGLFVIDKSDPANLFEVGSCDTPGDANNVSVAGGFAYLSAFNEGMRVIDISDPTDPFEAGFFDTPGSTRNIAVDGDFVYLADASTGLYKVDVSDPFTPVEVSFWDSPSWAFYAASQGVYGYVADGLSGIHIIDFTIPTLPTEVGFYDTPGSAKGIVVNDGLAYVADNEYFGIYECSDAVGLSPLIDVTLSTDGPIVVPAGETFNFSVELVSHFPVLTLVDIMAEAILPNGNIFTPLWLIPDVHMGPNSVIVAENIVQSVPSFASPGLYGFRFIVGTYPINKWAWDQFGFEITATPATVSFDEGWTAYGCEEAFGVAAEEANSPAALPVEYSISSAYPNPFNPSTAISVNLPDAAELSVVVYNVTGQKVAELANGQFNAGNHNLTFDASGMASGLYFVRATVPDQMDQVQKVMLVR